MNRFFKNNCNTFCKAFLALLFLLAFVYEGKAQSTFNFTDTDKHYAAGSIICAATAIPTYIITRRAWLSVLTGILFATGAGILKEKVYDDYFNKGTPSRIDAIETAWGGACAGMKIRIGFNEAEKKLINEELYQHLADSLNKNKLCSDTTQIQLQPHN